MPIRPRPIPSQELIREYLTYDPITGLVVKNTLGPERFKTKRAHSIHLARDAGKVVGTKNKHGYLFAMIAGTTYPLHRLIWALQKGGILESEYIDHGNGVRDDNRWVNLKCVTWAQNQRNSGLRVDNRTGFKGVSKIRSNRFWARSTDPNGVQVNLGVYDTPEEAYAVVMKYNSDNFGDNARTGPTTRR